jgi:3-oxoacyl-[acyl-carrier-protein] synthase-3
MSAQVTTLDTIEAYAPERSVPVEVAADRLGLNRHQARMFRRVHGLGTLRDDPAESLIDLIRIPAERVLATLPDRGSVRYLIYAHTIQNVTPSYLDAAQEVRRVLELDSAEAFAVTQQNCASGFAAVDIAGELLRAGGDPCHRALVVTGEKTFSRIAQLIENTSIMGEASAACLVGLDGPGARVRSYVVHSAGQHADIFRPSAATQSEFGNTFTARLIRVITQVVSEAGLSLDEIELIVPHNVNLSSWRKVIPELGVDRKQVFLDNIGAYGHTFCSDSFLNLATLRDEGRLVGGGHYVLVSVGLGATYAAMVVQQP